MREGMQIESVSIPTAAKLTLLESLSETGLTRVCVGSFVSAKYTPQMAAIEELVRGITPREGVEYTAVYLNEKGRERALKLAPPLTVRRERPALVYPMSDTFVRRNINASREKIVAGWAEIVRLAATERGAEDAIIGASAAWGCNFEGAYTQDLLLHWLRVAAGMWSDAGVPFDTVYLADPMSWCMPHRMEQDLRLIKGEWPQVRHFHLHLHNARGMATASIYAALRVLEENDHLHLETTAGGIGGCPYCGNGRAAGMAPTEDVVCMLEQMGIPTGVDIKKLIRAVWKLEEILERPASGHVSKAGPLPGEHELYDPNMPFVETHEEARHFLLGASAYQHQFRPWEQPIPAADASSSAPGKP